MTSISSGQTHPAKFEWFTIIHELLRKHLDITVSNLLEWPDCIPGSSPARAFIRGVRRGRAGRGSRFS